MFLDFDVVQSILEKKIKLICEDVEATQPPIIYFSDSEEITRRLNKLNKWRGEPLREFVPNFRYEAAKTVPYKGTRKNPKPEHFYNILFYLLAEYDCVISEWGLEADDMMCIEQSKRDDTIICSRDKDLRICPGWHFSWECGSQRSMGPTKTDRVGWLDMDISVKTKPNGKQETVKKVTGYGLSFFYYQMLVGDTADNIPGLPEWGAVKSYGLLSELRTEGELYKAVKTEYINTMGKDKAKEFFNEQANLLWMVQQEGVPFEHPN